MNKQDRIAIFGHEGLVGSAIIRNLISNGYTNLVTRTKKELDLRRQRDVELFFIEEKPKYIFLVAALVGGIKANNTRRGEFIYDNLMIQSNVIHSAYKNKVEKLIFTGSACIYNKENNGQPIKEEYLLTGALEPTNEPYAIAKIAGIKMCQAYNSQYGCNFISANPTNSYGINDHYDLDNSHVLPALLRKVITAKKQNKPTVEVWGTGRAAREFIYSDDMADGLVFLMNNYDSPELINLGIGEDLSIKELAEIIKEEAGWNGEFVFNGQMDGMMQRKLDTSKMDSMGWKPKTSLRDGIKKTIADINTKKYW